MSLSDRTLFTLGRKTYHSDSILVSHPSLSKKHLSLRPKGSSITLIHLGSSTTTLLNGKIIAKDQIIKIKKGKSVILKLGTMDTTLRLGYEIENRSRSRSRSKDKKEEKGEDKRKRLWGNKQTGVSKYQLDNLDVDQGEKEKFMRLMGYGKNKVSVQAGRNDYAHVNQQLEEQFEQSRGRFENRQGGLGLKE